MRVTANGIEIEFESIGEGEPLVLVMGLAAQLVQWPDKFCEMLATRGFNVIRFDNRDCGLSSKIGGEVVSPEMAFARRMLGLRIKTPYTLMDMADDIAGLLNVLKLQSAHIIGASMGGAIAQVMALSHPHRVSSFMSVMSSLGSKLSYVAKPSASRLIRRPLPDELQSAVAQDIAFFETVGGRGLHAPDLTLVEEISKVSFLRNVCPAGAVRQFSAVIASPERRSALAYVRMPATVIHGDADPLILPHNGRATAAAIPNSRLVMVKDMGHDMPPSLWPLLIDEIELLVERANRKKRQNGRE